MSGKTYHRILSAVVCVSLLLNSLWGVFLFPQAVFAEETTETAELELIEEVVPAPESSPTPLSTPDSDETEQIELPETLVEELEESPAVEESASLVVSLWAENEDGSVITSSTVGEGVEYRYKDTQTKVLFTKLTEPGYLTIREFEPENAEELGILGKAYEITSDMQNGTFLYDLTLPLPEEAGDDFEIKYAENGDSLDNAQIVEEFKEENENTVTIRGLNHFTVFIITDDEASYPGELWFDWPSQGYLDTGVHFPTTVPAGQIATWSFSTITPGTYSVSISWSTDPNRTTTAPYILNYNDGSLTFSINQELLADQTTTGGSGQWSGWYLLGAYSLNTDSTLVLTSVENSSESDYVIADEIRLTQAPTIVSPANNSFLKTAGLPKIDWTDSIGTNIPFTYQYQSFSDENYTVNRWGPSSWLSNSEIPTTGTPEGVYYIRVRAKDAEDNITDWSNGAGNPYKITVDNTSPLITWDSPNNGSIHNGTINLKAICSEDCDYVNFWWRAENEEYSSASKRYHYVYENGTEFEWNLDTLNAEKWDGSTYLMEDGAYYLYAAGKDLAGNWARTSEIQITVDNTSPTTPSRIGWTTENPPEGEDYEGGADFENYRTCGQSLNYSPMTNFWQPSTDNTGVIGYEREVYSPEETRIYSTTLSTNYQNGGGAIDGTTYWVRARAFDAAGNFSPWTEKCAITYDETPPLTILTSPENNSYWNEPIIVQGNSIDNVEVNSVNLSYQPIGNEIWFLITTLANELGSPSFNWTYPWQPSEEGIYNIKASAEDTAGNVEESAYASNITYDITAPDIPENLGFNVPPGDYSEPRPETDVACSEYTNKNQISHHWTDESESGAVLYQRQWQYPGGSTWHGAEEWETPYTNYRSFGGGEGAEGLWRVRVRARDLADNWSEWSEACAVTYDRISPNSFFTSPSDGRIFGGPEEEQVYIAGYSTDEPVETVDYTEIHYRVSEPENEWQLLEAFVNEGGDEPFYWEKYWTPEEDGTYDFKAIATDKAGNVEETAYVYGVIYDTTDPELSWTSPAEDTIISGTTIILSVATDNLSGVDSVTYFYQRDDGVDGWHEIDTLTNSPYETSWNTTGLALDNYNLKAVATDKANNSIETIRSVGVAAVISGETWSRPEFGKITVSWTTDRPTSGRVVYDTTSHSIDSSHPNYGYANTSGVIDSSPKTTNHTVTLSELLNGITYYWRTVSSGSPIVVSREHRGDTFSIPGPGGDGGGVVAGLTTDTIAATTSFVTGEVGEISVSEEEEVLGEETTTVISPEELGGFGESVLGKSKVVRVILWGGATLGGLILIYFFFFRRRKRR